MRKKIWISWSVYILGLIVLAGFFLCNFSLPHLYAQVNASVSTGNTTVSAGNMPLQKTWYGLPLRLKIPSLGINARILALGLTADGSMDTPKWPYDVAWFKLGQRPGITGSAVIAGHYGVWKNGDISIFNHLHEMKKWESIYVQDDRGNLIRFIVREIKKYSPDADATAVFTSRDGKPHLNLVTCILDPISKTYNQRLVVFADKF